jgi:3-deoxy-D-manno-octulosonate 8-phosphate phosphatase KdsC-like HAD superfamily phosphatase
MDLTSRRIVGTLVAVIAGGIAAAFKAGLANSFIITLVVELIALQLSSDEERHGQSTKLLSAVTLAQEIADSGEQCTLISALVADMSTVSKSGHPLFARQAHDRLVSFVDAIRRLSGGLMTITDAREIQMEGIWALEHLGEELFATSVVSMDTFWTTSHGPDYHHKNLEIVKRGRKITRVFILDSPEALKDIRLRNLLREQSDAGVDVWYVTADKLPSEAIIDFGIWDNEMVCTLRPSATAPGNVLDATYDTTPAGKQNAQGLRQLILHEAEQLASASPAAHIAQPTHAHVLLTESAPHMRTIATERCVGGYLDPKSCQWYHEAWQYLRLLQLVETPQLHENFFRHYIARYVETSDSTNVLLCGLADYEMCAVVFDALERAKASDYHLTALDVCDTPLRNTDWYATRRDAHVVTRRADATDTGLPSSSFELIITDAFLTKLPREERSAVISEWRRILVEGGQVLTTVKIGANGAEGVRADGRQINAYAQRAKERAQERQSDGFAAPDDVERLARAYAEHNVSYPMEADAEVEELFIGFDVSVLDVTPVSEYAVSYYGQVVAVKLP